MDMWAIYSREMDKADTDETSSSIFMRFLTLLRQNCREQREVAWYAGELCVTPKYLSAVCQKITGKGAAHWIEYYTLHEILLLLNNPALTLTEVTDRMHFPAPGVISAHFAASFIFCFRSKIYWNLGKKPGYALTGQSAFGAGFKK